MHFTTFLEHKFSRWFHSDRSYEQVATYSYIKRIHSNQVKFSCVPLITCTEYESLNVFSSLNNSAVEESTNLKEYNTEAWIVQDNYLLTYICFQARFVLFTDVQCKDWLKL